jgi:hypothetical protein
MGLTQKATPSVSQGVAQRWLPGTFWMESTPLALPAYQYLLRVLQKNSAGTGL